MAKSTYFGYNAPFASASGVFLPFQANERLIKNDLLQLLLTVPGERVMRPEFGTPIRAFPFDAMTNVAIEQLRSDIIDAITTFDRRVIIQNLELTNEDESNTLFIKLTVSLDIEPNKDFLLELGISDGNVSVARSSEI